MKWGSITYSVSSFTCSRCVNRFSNMEGMMPSLIRSLHRAIWPSRSLREVSMYISVETVQLLLVVQIRLYINPTTRQPIWIIHGFPITVGVLPFFLSRSFQLPLLSCFGLLLLGPFQVLLLVGLFKIKRIYIDVFGDCRIPAQV